MRSSIFLPFFLFIGLFSLSTQFSVAQSSNEELNDRLNGLLATARMPGFSASIQGKDQILYQYAGGVLNESTLAAYNLETLQLQPALNPLILTIATLKAVELGIISLDDEINTYLPMKVVHPKYSKNPILVRHLLSHTSGILDLPASWFKNYIFNAEFPTTDVVFETDGRWLKRVNFNSRSSMNSLLSSTLTPKGAYYTRSTFNGSKPGESYSYSLMGSALLGFVIESASGMFYDQFTQDYIFDPLQMKRSTWATRFMDDTNRSAVHVGSDRMILPDYIQVLYPASGFVSSMKDASILINETLSGLSGRGKVLSPDSWVLFKQLQQKYLDAHIPDLNPKPAAAVEALSSDRLTTIYAQNYGATSVLMIDSGENKAWYFTANTSVSHLTRGDYFINQILSVLLAHRVD